MTINEVEERCPLMLRHCGNRHRQGRFLPALGHQIEVFKLSRSGGISREVYYVGTAKRPSRAPKTSVSQWRGWLEPE